MMLVYQDETFGPVVPVIPFRTDDEAVAIANDTEYGLSSGVMTATRRAGWPSRSSSTPACATSTAAA
jgi:vanillin dehydrogenase